ncbi:urea ABC transporter permease subunit UrtB [Roseateles aquatilis]|uniref:Urea ABC transporter permease subunit UrtB n=1 Tax=Roseateles aquatilis TaxID=431061 RepID=A0A246J4P5_9BURK|nr:urea ABC transporter permease subunit UrtB [Roseateles aquatilis]OWQ87567.1 urea ABC transporter permease subunit UrtB [Roseateles aquatilis]
MRALPAVLALAALLGLAPAVRALTQPQALAVAQGDTDERIAALGRLVASPDARTAPLLQALADERLKLGADRRVLIATDAGLVDAATGAPVTLAPEAASALSDVMLNNRLRGELDGALASLKLSSDDRKERLAAAKALLDAGGDDARVALLESAIAREKDAVVLDALKLARAAALAASPDTTKRLAAARLLGESRSPETRLLLNQRLADEQDADVKRALQRSLREVEDTLAWGERLGALFTGISLASILLLVALGLAITYGLMGVINMAHGELMMIGAYATYLVQVAFRQWLPGGFDAYLVVAMPASFLASALVGAALERTVIRWLYGRPLETLLATWGLSLVLMQAVRSLFGAQNVAVESPAWMGGSLALLPGLALPTNRLVIIVFSLAVLGGMALLIARTRLGLFVRAVTQNRPIASCMGVPTARVDTYAFALGSGLAGLAGCALSQVGNVGPDLGQSYIVDAFMVVVLGGVGQLAGTVLAALGLGLANKALEGVVGAVLAKIAVLLFIIVFIQKRPQGLFAVKGRAQES